MPGSQLRRVAKTMATTEARHRDLVHGRHAAHQRQQQHARLLHPAAGARQHGRGRRRHQHLPRPRQRAGRHRPRRADGHPAGLLRPRRRLVEALGARLGCALRLPARPLRRPEDDGEGRHSGVALDRRRAREQGQPRPAGQHPGDGVLGPRAELADPRAGDEEGDGEARSPRRHRSLPDRLGRHARPHRRRLPAAGVDAVRDLGLGDGVEPLAAVAREGDRADVRVEARSRDHVPVRQEVRLRQGDVQEHQGRGRRAVDRGHHPRIQPRHVDDRLHRPVAGATQAAHGQPAHLRQGDAARPTAARATATTTACRGRAGAPRR